MGRLLRQVEGLGSGQLHARGQFVAVNAGFQPLVAGARGRMALVDSIGQGNAGGVAGAGDVVALPGGEQVGDRSLGARINHGALMLGGQKGAVPILGAVRAEAAMIGQNHERRQVFVQAAQSVADPAAHAGKSGPIEPGGLQQGSLAMHAGLADHVVDEGHFVDHLAQRCDYFAQQFAALAVRLKIPNGLHPRAQAVLKRFDRLAKIGRLAMVLEQSGLEVEQIDVAGRSGHEQLHHALGLGRKMRHARHAADRRLRRPRRHSIGSQ